MSAVVEHQVVAMAVLPSRMAFRAVLVITLVVVAVLPVGMLLWSPYLLSTLDERDRDWNRLSAMAQTYGAASALLSAVAIVGVAVSLLLQAREVKTNRMQAHRSLHVDLLKIAMEKPEYLECWGERRAGSAQSVEARQFLYVNLIFSDWEMRFRLGDMSEAGLRAECRVIFSGGPGQIYWRAARDRWDERYATSRSARRFVAIVDEEFQRLIPVDVNH